MECTCIYWTTSTGGYLEKRCPGDSGWVTDPSNPPGAGDGSFGGSTVTNPTTAPGTALPSDKQMVVNQANGRAKFKVHGRRVLSDTGAYVYEPTACTMLFDGSPLNQDGYALLDSYITYRGGENLVSSDGTTPCNEGAAAWTTCCSGARYVFVCNNFFSMTSSMQSTILIHEAMHVAGQREDKSNTAGPGDPPTTSEITSAVQSACGP